MTKTDDILLELNKTYANFVSSIAPFEYKNMTYRLHDSYIASPWNKCDICGHRPINKVFQIRSDYHTLRVGSKCIDRLTNLRVSETFTRFIKKRKNVINNRRYINGIDLILKVYKSNQFHFVMSEIELGFLEKAFERICKGLNLNRRQELLAESLLIKASQVKGIGKYLIH